jgi:hypothetical protein
MAVDITSLPLMRFLKEFQNGIYFGKSLELRDEIKGWLEYIPATFPHYTRHTIGHSEQIILQLSKLLFHNDDIERPVVNLSAVEAYILVASAYLHDAGMVVSDDEKSRIIQEEAWQNWVTGEGAAAVRWSEIERYRSGSSPSDVSKRNFLADLETRFLIAEYVRRVHHERAASVIQQHQSGLGRFAFDDPELQTAISDVCVAHGFHRDALDDRARFPLLRQIRGEDANLRLLAILLRLGDLLDLQSARACPLLINAACPLPAESYVHWDQYRRIRHRAITPFDIEISAQCESPDEHRVLRDWCQWIVDEVAAAPRLLAGSKRHTNWNPPRAKISGPDRTISIEPAPDAKYRSVDWRFELDTEEVFSRLIADAYRGQKTFVRELIQNSEVLPGNRTVT